MRVKNTIRNIIVAFSGQFLGIIITFIARTVFVHTLSAEYLGVNGLFTNILSMLSLAEMGFGTAIIYSMYKPLADKDEKKIRGLMEFFSATYKKIGLIILIIGLLLTPFLNVLIKDTPNIPHLTFIYILYLLNTVSTYFFAHKRTIITADQKEFISSIYRYSFVLITNITQIIILIVTKNFILFLVVQVILKLVENVLVANKANSLYPYINTSDKIELDQETKNTIFRNVRAMVYHRFGGVIVNGTDNILISSFVGLKWVGLYSNYFLIISAINTIISQVFTSMTASVGNLNALENKEKTEKVFQSIFFTNFWLYGFSSIALWILINPFINLWLGSEYVFSDEIVFLIIVNFYLKGMRRTTLIFRDSMGLFWHDRYKSIFESLVNIVVSIILAKKYGIAGVLIGTLMSTLTTCFWIEPYVLYKYGFKSNIMKYFKKYGFYTFGFIIAGVITYIISLLLISQNTISSFVLLLCLTIIIPNIMFYIFFKNTNEFNYIINLTKSLIGKIKEKSKSI
jgi:O-antigen/teichoic acid export membrane protein